MKKMIAAFDGLKYSTAAKEYTISLAKQTNLHVVGAFLDDPTYTSYKIYDLIAKEGVSEAKLKELEAKDKAIRANAATDFENACREATLEYSIHHDKHIAIHDLKHESIYADLLLIDAKETLTHYPEALPTRFIRDLLSDVQCPVILVPSKYTPIQKVVLLYDGEPSSVFAIKMFSYLLPQLKYLNTEVITVNPIGTNLHLPENKLMKEFMKRHYPDAKYTVLEGFAEYEVVKYLARMQDHPLVVLGAYRRGAVSRWFRESMADVLMKELQLPLFVAHHK
ncbi:MAG: universal stress protein [Chitinophagaceae bacterium]|nr:universal stress protein [Chitinophagaceae bacterium]